MKELKLCLVLAQYLNPELLRKLSAVINTLQDPHGNQLPHHLLHVDPHLIGNIRGTTEPFGFDGRLLAGLGLM